MLFEKIRKKPVTKSVDELRAIVAPIAKRNKIAHVSLFGSRARGDFKEESDYDFLILSESDASLMDLGRFVTDMQDALGKPISIANERSGNEVFLNSIRDDLIEIYA